jgi:hypothetical protein
VINRDYVFPPDAAVTLKAAGGLCPSMLCWRRNMKKFLVLSVAITFLPLMLFAGSKKTAQNGITVAGTTQGNVGCMILEKHMPVKHKLLFAGVIYARTEYRVLKTFNYKPARQKYTGQGEIKELNQAAVRDKVKLVVLPSDYTQDQMDQARKMCGK